MKLEFIVGLASCITALPTNQVSRNNRDVKLDKFYPGDEYQDEISDDDILHTFIFCLVWVLGILIILWVCYYCIYGGCYRSGRNVQTVDGEQVERSNTSLAIMHRYDR